MRLKDRLPVAAAQRILAKVPVATAEVDPQIQLRVDNQLLGDRVVPERRDADDDRIDTADLGRFRDADRCLRIERIAIEDLAVPPIGELILRVPRNRGRGADLDILEDLRTRGDDLQVGNGALRQRDRRLDDSANQASQSSPILGKAPVNSRPLNAPSSIFILADFIIFIFAFDICYYILYVFLNQIQHIRK